LLVAVGYLTAKLLFWQNFQLCTAPVLIGIFFLGAVQLFLLGLLGEYIGAIQTQVHNLPLVVEAERINFDDNADERENDPESQPSRERCFCVRLTYQPAILMPHAVTWINPYAPPDISMSMAAVR